VDLRIPITEERKKERKKIKNALPDGQDPARTRRLRRGESEMIPSMKRGARPFAEKRRRDAFVIDVRAPEKGKDHGYRRQERKKTNRKVNLAASAEQGEERTGGCI